MFPIAGILLVLWFMGIGMGESLGGYIHVFLIIAIVLVVIRLTLRRSDDDNYGNPSHSGRTPRSF